MKKMNKKGFTLIELLAVIVVLAIVMVIAIPTVLGSLDDARLNAFKASANSAADWFEKQYSYCKVGDATISGDAFDDTNYPGTTGSCTFGTASSPTSLSKAQLQAAGLNDIDYSATVYVKSNGRACVTLKATTTGKFKNVKWTEGGTEKTATANGTTSSGC